MAPPPFYPAPAGGIGPQSTAGFASPPFWPEHSLAAKVKPEPESDEIDSFALGDVNRHSTRSITRLRAHAASDDIPSSSAMLLHGHAAGSSFMKPNSASLPHHDTVQGASFDASESSSSEGDDVSQSQSPAAQTQRRPRKRGSRTYSAEQRVHKQQLDRAGKKRGRDQYRGAKEGILSQLAPRPSKAGSWETELAKREEASKRAEQARENGQPLRDCVSKDAKRPWKPLAVITTDIQHDDLAAGSSSAGPSNLASQPPTTSPSPTSAFNLPFAN